MASMSSMQTTTCGSSSLLVPLQTQEQWKQVCWVRQVFLTDQGWKPAIVGFGASSLEPSMLVQQVLETLASVAVEKGSTTSLVFGYCDVEQPGGRLLATEWGITSVPCVALLRNGELVHVLQGTTDPPTITRACREFMKDCHLSLEERLEKLVHRQPIMLFMKGTPEQPCCKFSKRMVEILEAEGIAFDYFNILDDLEVRQGLKRYANWPTYPQLYVHGELIGGLDIVEQLYANGSLKQELHMDGNKP